MIVVAFEWESNLKTNSWSSAPKRIFALEVGRFVTKYNGRYLKLDFKGAFSRKLVVFWLNLITYLTFRYKSPPYHIIVWCWTVDDSLTGGWVLMMAWRQTDGMRYNRPMITRLIMKRLTFYLQIHVHCFTPSWSTGVIAMFITSSSRGYLLYISVNKMEQTLPAWTVLLNGPLCYCGSTKVKFINRTEKSWKNNRAK